MLTCLSVGVSEYKDKRLCSIPCAKDDARSVYEAFRLIMGSDFNQYLSLCVSNILCSEFESLLDVISREITNTINQSDPILVIYFSGHGTYSEGTLKLLFPGYNGEHDRRGDFFPVRRINEFFRDLDVKILIILDCCASGAALPFANLDDQKPEISVLASVNSYQTAKFDETGSKFTKALCKSIYEIERSGETFSLRLLVETISAIGYTDALVHRGAAKELDILFRNKTSINSDNFPELFFCRLSHSNALSREALWYALNDFHDKEVYDACARYFGLGNKYSTRAPFLEANWLVRRAIGSTLANHTAYPPILELLGHLLESAYWQEQCIALIGLRYLIRTNNNICRQVIELVENSRIRRVDAVWLALLYSSDNDTTDWRVFLNTTLGATPWGMIELCKAFKLFGTDMDDPQLHANRYYSDLLVEKERQSIHVASTLEEYVYKATPRGRLPENSRVKFLLSALYGNWRDQIILELGPYLECSDTNQANYELEQLNYIYNVERKMALFAYFNREHESSACYRDALKWGLSDAHPWVRRSAMEFYQKLGMDDDTYIHCYLSVKFDENYPGLLDFYLTCPVSLRQDLINYIRDNNILPAEDLRSLEQSFSCE